MILRNSSILLDEGVESGGMFSAFDYPGGNMPPTVYFVLHQVRWNTPITTTQINVIYIFVALYFSARPRFNGLTLRASSTWPTQHLSAPLCYHNGRSRYLVLRVERWTIPFVVAADAVDEPWIKAILRMERNTSEGPRVLGLYIGWRRNGST